MGNKIEIGNARIREVLRDRRGMPVDRRIKAGFWWCCINSEAPMPYDDMTRSFPTTISSWSGGAVPQARMRAVAKPRDGGQGLPGPSSIQTTDGPWIHILTYNPKTACQDIK